jgi:hypothetical protein
MCLGCGARVNDEGGDCIRLVLGVQIVVLVDAVKENIERGGARHSPRSPPPEKGGRDEKRERGEAEWRLVRKSIVSKNCRSMCSRRVRGKV